jgi:hypothetical protein
MRFLVALILLAFFPLGLTAQIAEPQSIALGGAGVSYLDGINALYTNPANLRFTNQNEKFAIEFLRAGASRNTPNLLLPGNSEEDQVRSWMQFNNVATALSIAENESISEILISKEDQNFAAIDNNAELVWLQHY